MRLRTAVTLIILAVLVMGHRPAAVQYFKAVPLVDFTASTPKYLNQFAGNLYDGSNTPPADYATYSQSIAQGITPLDSNGNPSPSGHIVLLSAGMSNTAIVWCIAGTASVYRAGCTAGSTSGAPDSFMGQAATSPNVNHTSLMILNGAHAGRDAAMWVCALGTCGGDSENEYDRVRDSTLAPSGLTEAQVQAVWVLQADNDNSYFLPSPQAEAYTLETEFGTMLRAMLSRWPNLRLVEFSCLNYTGYAGTATTQGVNVGLPEEPNAYEGCFSVKWLIAAKIQQFRSGTIDPIAGDLSNIPIVSWSTATYLWGSGTSNPRHSLALSWAVTDLMSNGIHPSDTGAKQAAARLLAGMLSAPLFIPWFTH